MFKKYPSIENSYREKTIDIIKNLYSNEIFYVTEKLHGANMSISINRDGYTLNRRGGPLDGEKFYSSHNINFYDIVDNIRPFLNGIEVIIYGELIGGNYPHPDVGKTNDISVQNGVFYSPKNEFFIFDIFDTISEQFVDYQLVVDICKMANINYVPIRMIGTLEDCLQYSNCFPSAIPFQLGLPEIYNNICEGVVIKPKRSLNLPNGDRVILKNKNNKFSEKQKVGKIKQIIELSEEENCQLQECAELINLNRLDCVLSKLGQVKTNQFGMIVGLLTKDVLEEYGEVSKEVNKRINGLCANLIRENFDKVFND